MMDSETAGSRILNRLRAAGRREDGPSPVAPPAYCAGSREARIADLTSRLEAVRAEVHPVTRSGWVDTVKELLTRRGASTLVTAPETPVGKAVHAAWRSGGEGLPALVPYDQDISGFKETLFSADAAITAARGAIAETGAVVLWPDRAEPRLMSLVPPIHIAVLDADDIVDTFGEMMEKQRWADAMPTNALLISGPSKTADIELVLAFGVHGPRELIVLIVTDGPGAAQQH